MKINSKKLLPNMQIGDLIIHLNSHEIEFNNTTKRLTNKEFQLLCYLIENQEILLTREKILDKVWGYDYYGDARAVDTYIKMLRKEMGEYSRYIKTIVRSGYKFSIKGDIENEDVE